MLLSLLLLMGCGPGSDDRPVGPPVQVQLVVHVDPLIRGPTRPCVSADLTRCGDLMGPAFVRRSRNLEWLVNRWTATGRSLDLQMGPEMAMAWSGDASVLGDLSEELADGEASRSADRVRGLIEKAVEERVVTVGVHAHSQRMDASGLWGDLDALAAIDPCAVKVEPVGAVDTARAGVDAVRTFAEGVGAQLHSFGSHLPRTMAQRIELVDSEGLTSLGAGASECFGHEHDHPVFERFASSDEGALRVAEGPSVNPGIRVVGSMAPHLGVSQDGSLGASRRRLVQLILNWRQSVLSGEGDRSWFFSFHTHLFDLMEGEPSPEEPGSRGLSATEGQRFRTDLEGLASSVDAFASMDGLMGARSSGSGLMEWTATPDLAEPGPDNPGTYEQYPYLPVVALLDNSHMVCSASSHGVWMAGFERCDAGWRWGGDSQGFSCSDGAEPDWLGVIVPESEGCQPIPWAGEHGWPLDGEDPETDRYSVHDNYDCWGELFVPQAGLLVETDERSLLPSFCLNG